MADVKTGTRNDLDAEVNKKASNPAKHGKGLDLQRRMRNKFQRRGYSSASSNSDNASIRSRGSPVPDAAVHFETGRETSFIRSLMNIRCYHTDEEDDVPRGRTEIRPRLVHDQGYNYLTPYSDGNYKNKGDLYRKKRIISRGSSVVESEPSSNTYKDVNISQVNERCRHDVEERAKRIQGEPVPHSRRRRYLRVDSHPSTYGTETDDVLHEATPRMSKLRLGNRFSPVGFDDDNSSGSDSGYGFDPKFNHYHHRNMFRQPWVAADMSKPRARIPIRNEIETGRRQHNRVKAEEPEFHKSLEEYQTMKANSSRWKNRMLVDGNVTHPQRRMNIRNENAIPKSYHKHVKTTSVLSGITDDSGFVTGDSRRSDNYFDHEQEVDSEDKSDTDSDQSDQQPIGGMGLFFKPVPKSQFSRTESRSHRSSLYQHERNPYKDVSKTSRVLARVGNHRQNVEKSRSKNTENVAELLTELESELDCNPDNGSDFCTGSSDEEVEVRYTSSRHGSATDQRTGVLNRRYKNRSVPNRKPDIGYGEHMEPPVAFQRQESEDMFFDEWFEKSIGASSKSSITGTHDGESVDTGTKTGAAPPRRGAVNEPHGVTQTTASDQKWPGSVFTGEDPMSAFEHYAAGSQIGSEQTGPEEQLAKDITDPNVYVHPDVPGNAVVPAGKGGNMKPLHTTHGPSGIPSALMAVQQQGTINQNKDEVVNIENPEDLQVIQQLLAYEQLKAQSNMAPQASQAMNTILIVDTSGSMGGDTLIQVGQFITQFIAGLEELQFEHGLQENVALVSIGEGIQVVQHFTNDYSLVKQATDTLCAAGPSKLHFGLVLPLALIQTGNTEANRILRIQKHIVTPRIILISDGNLNINDDVPGHVPYQNEPNMLSLQNFTMELVNKVTMDTLCKIFCVPIGTSLNLNFLEILANSSGGSILHPHMAKIASKYHLHHVVVATLQCMSEDEPSKDTIRQTILTVNPQMHEAEVDIVLDIWKQAEPDVEANNQRLAMEANARQQEKNSGGRTGTMSSDLPGQGTPYMSGSGFPSLTEQHLSTDSLPGNLPMMDLPRLMGGAPGQSMLSPRSPGMSNMMPGPAHTGGMQGMPGPTHTGGMQGLPGPTHTGMMNSGGPRFPGQQGIGGLDLSRFLGS